MAIGDSLKNYTWLNIMNLMMGEVSDDVDKRQGSVIYDTLSPAASANAVIIDLLKLAYLNTFIATAQGEYLDRKCEDIGLSRIEATNAIRRVYIYDKEGNLMDLPIGTLISPKGDGTLLFSLNEQEATGTYKCRCTTSGIIGNQYIGECVAISNLTTIGSVMMTDLIESARDEETDEQLRARYKETVGAKGFGGNIPAYRNLVGNELSSVGQMQVYPCTASDGKIVCSVVNASNEPMSSEELNNIQESLDPTAYPGEGKGLVPMGQHPIIVSPTEITVTYEMTITPQSGRSVAELKGAIEDKVKEYTEEIRNLWATPNLTYGYDVVIYVAQIIGKVMEVNGVLSVNNVLINGNNSDLILTENKDIQQIPKLGTIIIN